MVLATIIRLEFAYPGVGVLAGDSIQYLSLASAHGVIMVFFMIMPLLFGAFANFLLPTQLGVHDVAFPRLNSAAFWFLPGGLLMLCQLVCIDRRYQRMNCFNIREVESLLKRRFFTDLINSKDHHTLLDTTAIGLRYKINDNSFLTNNINLTYNYGLELNPQIRSNLYLNYFKQIKTFDNVQSFDLNSYIFKIVSYFNVTNVFFLLNYFLFFFLEKSFLFISFSKIFNDLIFISNFLYKIFYIIENFLTNTINLIINLFSFLIINFSSLMCFILFFLRTLFESVVYFWPYLCIIFFNFLQQLKLCINYFLKFTRQFSISFLELQNYFANLVKDGTFFSNKNFLYNYYFTFLSYFNLFIKKLRDESKFDTDLKRFDINYDFANNGFIFNMYNVFKISTNNLYAVGSTKNLRYMFKSMCSRNNYVEYPSYPNKKSEPIAFVTLWKKSLVNNYWNSLMLEFYALLYFFLNLPLIPFTLFIYSISDHWLMINFHKFPVDFSFWIYNTVNGTDVWGRKFTKEYSDNLLSKLSLSNLVYIENFFKRYFIFADIFFTKLIDFLNTVAEFFVLYDRWNSLKNFSNEIFSGYWIHLQKLYQSSYLIVMLDKAKKNRAALYSDIFDSKISNIIYNKIRLVSHPVNDSIAQIAKDDLLLNSEEISNNSRFLRFNNPVFKYDYKSGDYFPKLYKDSYPFLIPSILDLTSGLRTPSWYFSAALPELLESSLVVTLNNLEKKINFNDFAVTPTKHNKIAHSDAFYNFFLSLNNPVSDLNVKWISTNSLNYKFNRMFLTSSLQQRIYNNWRSLKFTRESWRCKMLLTRHQKTLFRRYMHEDGIFWSIERNAKDLIPGWAMITPFSSRTRYTAVGKTDIGLMGVLLVLNSSIISGANFLVTYRYLSTLNNRKMRDARAFFTEAVMVASWMMILANPMLVIGIIMLISDRHWQTSFFDYSGGGDTVLFQHMFWFFGHPEVYVIIIPTFGFTNTMVSYYLKKRVSARASLLYSLYTIAFLGFFVWGHHMYMVGLSHTTRMLFSTLTVMISVPAATKIMHWCVTTANSVFTMELPLVFTYTFIFFFVSGGISGMCVAHTGMDVLFHDTFYVIGHFHVMLAGGAMFASFGAFYFYFPAIFGVKYSRVYAYLHYVYYLIGQLMTVIPMLWLGYAGMPRRVLDYPAAFGGWHSVISAGHMLNVAGLMAFFIMIFDSLRQAKAATRNNFGINRYNTRLNFYIYEIARLTYVQQKSLFLFRLIKSSNLKLNNKNYTNFEPFESVLFSYILLKK